MLKNPNYQPWCMVLLIQFFVWKAIGRLPCRYDVVVETTPSWGTGNS